jgi:hypothetical protein
MKVDAYGVLWVGKSFVNFLCNEKSHVFFVVKDVALFLQQGIFVMRNVVRNGFGFIGFATTILASHVVSC